VTETSEEFKKATDYSFKEEDIEAAKALVGQWRPSGAREWLTEVTRDSMRNFARSYGDDNPLFIDRYYGAKSRWGAQIAPPMITIGLNKPLYADPPGEEVKKFKRPSFRGIHVFVSGSRWNWYQPLVAGDEVFSFSGTESCVEKRSEFAERSVHLTYATVKMNQRGEIVAIARTLAIHTVRKTAREKGKYADLQPATYTDADIEKIDAIYAAEHVQGGTPRYWEDVEVGEALQPMAKGPLTTTDMIVFHAGGYGFIPYEPCVNRIAYNNRQRIKPFYVKNEYGVPDVAQRVHWDSQWAQAIGNPMAYDYGVMRDCHLAHFMTDWMGDHGWLVEQSSEIRKFNYIGDTHTFTGEVVGKRIEDGNHLVDIEMRGTNQRDTVTCLGRATIALPSKEGAAVTLPAPPQDLAEEAARLMARHHEIAKQRGEG
jgi:acyl dehydratase